MQLCVNAVCQPRTFWIESLKITKIYLKLREKCLDMHGHGIIKKKSKHDKLSSHNYMQTKQNLTFKIIPLEYIELSA